VSEAFPAVNDVSQAAIVSVPDEGAWFTAVPGERMSIRVRSAEVDGRYAIIESITQPGAAAPIHYHQEDEIFLVVEGVMTFSCGGKLFEAKAGTTVVVPAGAHHAWKNRTTSTVRMFITFSPGGFETVLERIGGCSIEEIAALAASRGSQVVGPPIDG